MSNPLRMYWRTSQQPAILMVETTPGVFSPYNSFQVASLRLSTPDHVDPFDSKTTQSIGSPGYATMQKLLKRGYVLVNENIINGGTGE